MESMLPTLRPGDQVLVWRWVRPGPGDIVVARVGHNFFIKRVSRVTEGKYLLLGDNPRALEATTPTVHRSDIVGRVFYVQERDIDTVSN